jgi:hypothetical protein
MLRTGVKSPWDEASLENIVMLPSLFRSQDCYHMIGGIIPELMRETLRRSRSSSCQVYFETGRRAITLWNTMSRDAAEAQFSPSRQRSLYFVAALHLRDTNVS